MKRKRVPCEHGRQRSLCKDCGGSGVCEHGRRRDQCKDCGGSSFCEHGRRRSTCKDCGGGSMCEHGRERRRCKDCRFARAAADAQERRQRPRWRRHSGRARRCGRTGERDGSASASGCTDGDAEVWRVYLCALLLVLNHAILNKSTRAEEGERWAHPLGGLSYPVR
jgi:hypothetical protein